MRKVLAKVSKQIITPTQFTIVKGQCDIYLSIVKGHSPVLRSTEVQHNSVDGPELSDSPVLC